MRRKRVVVIVYRDFLISAFQGARYRNSRNGSAGVSEGNNCRPTKGVDMSRVCTYVDGTPRAHVPTRFRDVYRAAWRGVASRTDFFRGGRSRTAHARIPQMPKVDAIASKRRGKSHSCRGLL